MQFSSWNSTYFVFLIGHIATRGQFLQEVSSIFFASFPGLFMQKRLLISFEVQYISLGAVQFFFFSHADLYNWNVPASQKLCFSQFLPECNGIPDLKDFSCFQQIFLPFNCDSYWIPFTLPQIFICRSWFCWAAMETWELDFINIVAYIQSFKFFKLYQSCNNISVLSKQELSPYARWWIFIFKLKQEFNQVHNYDLKFLILQLI